jgi:hypothetical protein
MDKIITLLGCIVECSTWVKYYISPKKLGSEKHSSLFISDEEEPCAIT